MAEEVERTDPKKQEEDEPRWETYLQKELEKGNLVPSIILYYLYTEDRYATDISPLSEYFGLPSDLIEKTVTNLTETFGKPIDDQLNPSFWDQFLKINHDHFKTARTKQIEHLNKIEAVLPQAVLARSFDILNPSMYYYHPSGLAVTVTYVNIPSKPHKTENGIVFYLSGRNWFRTPDIYEKWYHCDRTAIFVFKQKTWYFSPKRYNERWLVKDFRDILKEALSISFEPDKTCNRLAESIKDAKARHREIDRYRKSLQGLQSFEELLPELTTLQSLLDQCLEPKENHFNQYRSKLPTYINENDPAERQKISSIYNRLLIDEEKREKFQQVIEILTDLLNP